jgi:hypothetical protein
MNEIRDIHDRLGRIEDKIDGLMEFKVVQTTSIKWVALIISGVCGIFTFITTSIVTYYTLLKTR